MPGESQPNPPSEESFLRAAAAELLMGDGQTAGINAEYQEFVRAAKANEAPFRLTRTQQIAFASGCVLFMSWGVNAMIEADDAPQPLGTISSPSPTTRPSPGTSSQPANQHGPISGKGGAPNFKHFADGAE